MSLFLGILNAFVRPILMLIALPLLIFTLGLFTLVINALLLCMISLLLPFFHVDSFRLRLRRRSHHQPHLHGPECPDRQRPRHRPAPSAATAENPMTTTAR